MATPEPCPNGEASTNLSAMERLKAVLSGQSLTGLSGDDFGQYERELHALFAEAEREVIARKLAELDVDAPAISVEGKTYRRALRCSAPYMTRGGTVQVERTLYRRHNGERTICPLELRAGIVDGFWTPLAAMLAAWVVAHVTTAEAEEFFARMGDMAPSRSSLDRLPKQLSDVWEAQRAEFECQVRSQDAIPEKAAVVALSLDGVMVSMKDSERQRKRDEIRASGKSNAGPAGYREASCATLTFYDATGNRLGTRYLGRMPESKKATLKQMLTDEYLDVYGRRPDLIVVAVADGAKDNWDFFDSLPIRPTEQIVDFFHATQKLKDAMDAAYGTATAKATAQYDKLRNILLMDPKGVAKVIDALRYQHKCHPRRKTIETVLGYFRRYRGRMKYADFKQRKLPIGSGVVEAANKTLVTVRMKRAGARWRHRGGQAVLTFRALAKSRRFDTAWKLLVAHYTKSVEVPENVVELSAFRRSVRTASV